ncbi:MAG: hypothetical protein AB7E85_02025 [Pseudobdellovibrionaceae bacterium]
MPDMSAHLYPEVTSRHATRAFIVYCAESELKRVAFLKKGFKHCYVLLFDGAHWVSYDPLASRSEIAVHDLPSGFDLPAWLTREGHIVQRAPVVPEAGRTEKPLPILPFTCVEAVKRVLGLRMPFVFTPYQLFKKLQTLT